MKKISYVFGILLLFLCIAGGITHAQNQTWHLVEENFYELGRNPGYIPTADRLRPMILGFDHAVSDLYWIRAGQYVGGNAGSGAEALSEYMDLITDLDPGFQFAYTFAAWHFPLNTRTADHLLPLLDKGIAYAKQNNKPDMLPQLMINRAYYISYFLEDSVAGAEAYEECAYSVPNCPKYAKNVAAFLRGKMGRHNISLRLWLEKAGEQREKNDVEIQTEMKKIEEASKLVALTCASEHFRAQKENTLTDISDLVGTAVSPCSGFDELPPNFLQALRQMSFASQLTVINHQTLMSPFDHNPFEWSHEKEAVRTKYW